MTNSNKYWPSKMTYIVTGVISCILFIFELKVTAITLLASVIFLNIVKIRLNLKFSSIPYYVPLAISLMQLLGITAVFILGISPLAINSVRSNVFNEDAIYLVLLCNLLQTLATIAIARAEIFDIKTYKVSRFVIVVGLIVTIVATWGSNSDMSMTLSKSYSESLASRTSLAWGGWPLLYVVSTSLIIVKLTSMNNALRKISFGIIALEVLYFLAHGNRSEVLIVALFCAAHLILKKSSLHGNSSNLKNIALAITIGVLFYVVGEMRDGSESIGGLLRGDYLYLSTISGSLWSQIATTSLHSPYGEAFGETYTYYLKNILPSFVPAPWDKGEPITSFVSDASIVGGIGLWGEAYINFGIFGVLAFIYLFTLFYLIILRRARTSLYYSVFLISLALYMPRILLYDIIYLVKLIFLFVLIGFTFALIKVKPSNNFKS